MAWTKLRQSVIGVGLMLALAGCTAVTLDEPDVDARLKALLAP